MCSSLSNKKRSSSRHPAGGVPCIKERRDIQLWQIRKQNKDLSKWMMRVVRATKLGAAPPLQ